MEITRLYRFQGGGKDPENLLCETETQSYRKLSVEI
jgi:hypothetical protein